MAKDRDIEQEDAIKRAEEIGAKTPGEARAKVESDAANAPTTVGPRAASRPRESVHTQARRALGIDEHDVKSSRHEGDAVIIERYTGPTVRVTVSQLSEPLLAKALENYGIKPEEVKGAPGMSPTAIEIPVLGVKKDDPRFHGHKGITVPVDGMVSIDRQALLDVEAGEAKPKRKGATPASQDLNEAAITKSGVDRNKVTGVRRDVATDEMVVTLKDGTEKRVRIATL